MINLADKIKQYRKQENLTQEELGKRLFVSRQAVSKWEQGRGWPSMVTLEALARLLHVSIDELVSSEDGKVIAIQANAEAVKTKKHFKVAIVALIGIIAVISIIALVTLLPRDTYTQIGLIGFYVDVDNTDGEVDLYAPAEGDHYAYSYVLDHVRITADSGAEIEYRQFEMHKDFTAYDYTSYLIELDVAYKDKHTVYLIIENEDGSIDKMNYADMPNGNGFFRRARVRVAWFTVKSKYAHMSYYDIYDSYNANDKPVGRDITVSIGFLDASAEEE